MSSQQSSPWFFFSFLLFFFVTTVFPKWAARPPVSRCPRSPGYQDINCKKNPVILRGGGGAWTSSISTDEGFSFGAGVVVRRLLCVAPALCPAPPLGWIHLLLVRAASFPVRSDVSKRALRLSPASVSNVAKQVFNKANKKLSPGRKRAQLLCPAQAAAPSFFLSLSHSLCFRACRK